MMRLAVLVYGALVVVAVVINLARGVPLVPLAFGPRFLPALAAALAAAGITIIVSAYGAERWEWAKRLETTFRAALGPLEGSEVLLLALSSGIAEEIFFRGALQPALIRFLGSDLLGVLLATSLFAALHSGPDPSLRAWTIFALAIGLFLGAVTLVSGNLLPAIVCHVAVNAVNLRRIARPVSRP